ncbi:MAG: NfeD family protein [Ruminococcaceae bacterium]|nr:NfeD family protein [Oscillospiraceae bacterium]
MMNFNVMLLLNAAENEGFDMGILWPALAWLGVLILSLIVEAQTADMGAICFAPGALVGMILAVLSVDPVIQIVVCLVISITLLVLAKTVLKRFVKKHHKIEKTDASAMEGKIATVIEEVDNKLDQGVVKINGQLWSARLENEGETAAVGEHVTVVHVSGSKLICQRQK